MGLPDEEAAEAWEAVEAIVWLEGMLLDEDEVTATSLTAELEAFMKFAVWKYKVKLKDGSCCSILHVS